MHQQGCCNGRCSSQVYRLLGLRRDSRRWFSMNKIGNSALESRIPLQGVPKSGVPSPQAASASDGGWGISRETAHQLLLVHTGHLFASACWAWGDIALNPGASALGSFGVNLSLCGWQQGENDWNTGSENSINQLPCHHREWCVSGGWHRHQQAALPRVLDSLLGV